MRSTRVWSHCAAVSAVVASLVVAPLTATGHPSDFQTLTIDLLFGADGLEAIDAAVVEGTGYQPFPSVELREQVAEDVLAALDLAEASVSIDPELSERYHEVGFFVAFAPPRPGDGEPIRVDSAPLQRIAKDANLEKLKLSVCSESFDAFTTLEIGASREGRAPIDSKAERSWCKIWELTAEGAPVTVTVDALALPVTGAPSIGMVVVALTVSAGGLILVVGLRPSRAGH